MDRLEEIRERESKATPGPWVRNDEEFCARICAKEYAGDIAHVGRANDSDFIAHAREDIPWLLAEVERMRGERDAALRRAEAAEADLGLVAKLLMECHKISMCEVCKGLSNPNDYCAHVCSMLKIESQFTWRGPEPGGEG